MSHFKNKWRKLRKHIIQEKKKTQRFNLPIIILCKHLYKCVIIDFSLENVG